MKLNNTIFIAIFFGCLNIFFTGCSPPQLTLDPQSSRYPPGRLPNGLTLTTPKGDNVLPFTVNGTTCRAGSYPNKPCVSITVCAPGTSTCQSVNDILLDTGSYGLRVFKSALGATGTALAPASTATALATCAEFGDGTSLWGPVVKAQVTLGNESAITIPIQLVDSNFPDKTSNTTVSTSASNYCPSTSETGDPSSSPSESGFNGILGVGLLTQDCGSDCVTNTRNGAYFSCSSSNNTWTCAGSTASLTTQVQNPVASLSTDNNGLIIQLPSVPLGGQASTSGYIIFGIGTNNSNTSLSNNTPNTNFVASYSAGDYGSKFQANIQTSYNSIMSTSFIDSGSNFLYFPTPGKSVLPDCGVNSGFFCPPSVANLSAMNFSITGGESGLINFQIGNTDSLVTTGKNVFLEIGADSGKNGPFDWGLPFFFGRNVYIQFTGKKSASFGTGPLWAY